MAKTKEKENRVKSVIKKSYRDKTKYLKFTL